MEKEQLEDLMILEPVQAIFQEACAKALAVSLMNARRFVPSRHHPLSPLLSRVAEVV